MSDVDDIAALVLARQGPTTALTLQKLVYYAQAWSLALDGQPLFDAEIQAWKDGPVVRHLYNQHRTVYRLSAWPAGDPARVGRRAAAIVDRVLRRYGDYSPAELSRFTHAELPWRAARAGLAEGERGTGTISPELMRDYYRRQRLEPADAVAAAVGNSALEGYTLDAADADLIRAVAAGQVPADEAVSRIVAAGARA